MEGEEQESNKQTHREKEQREDKPIGKSNEQSNESNAAGTEIRPLVTGYWDSKPPFRKAACCPSNQ
jgi:hypothetical protein